MINSTRAFSAENMLRVEQLLPKAGYSEDAAHELANIEVLKAGRQVLLQKCVQCHDLRTILAKPRTPKGWADLVERMANKPIIGLPIIDEEIDWATTYLVGITPDLQSSLKRKRRSERVVAPLRAKAPASDGTEHEVDMAAAQLLWEETCSQCHELSEIDDYGGDDEEGWRDTVVRMVEENELYEEAEVLEQIIQYLAWSRPL